ncbi:uncharacterized protein LOC113462437 [Phoenix dactylifera]|uniref:Uncharacterized protein LOC113462437 n=1 Tax=Phoenix dactylifera TaxID=42345 RepID=A0A8B8J1I3_PHODC|nr:uncharacterized protein LOC113462437 [Phoenix dactylifera]
MHTRKRVPSPCGDGVFVPLLPSSFSRPTDLFLPISHLSLSLSLPPSIHPSSHRLGFLLGPEFLWFNGNRCSKDPSMEASRDSTTRRVDAPRKLWNILKENMENLELTNYGMTAIPFKDVLKEFEVWLSNHHLWKKEQGGSLNHAAFVTCGDWDLKIKIPDQCMVLRIKIPPCFMK